MFYECFRNKNENETGSFKLKKNILFYTHHVPYVVFVTLGQDIYQFTEDFRIFSPHD